MAAQTLFFRSTQSALVTATTTCKLLSTTIGPVANQSAGITHGGASNTWQFIPGSLGNSTTYTISATPNTKGYLFDASAAGTYAAGNWTYNAEVIDSGTGGNFQQKLSLWVVTYSTTAVTSVTQLASAIATTGVAPSTTKNTQTVAFSLPAVTLAANQALYAETYLTATTGGGLGSSMKFYTDDTGVATASSIVTTSFTAGGAAPVRRRSLSEEWF